MKKNVLKYAWLFIFILPLGFSACGDDPVEEADKAALVTKISDAEAVVADAVVGKLAGQFSQEAIDALNTAIDAAKAINDDELATQVAVDATVSNLQLAMDDFVALANVEISAENLVAYWKFDGDAVDASGNSHDGTLMPGLVARFPDGGDVPTAATDRYGVADMALHFAHGANVEVPFSADFNPDQMSISLWLKADSIASVTQYLVSLNIWNCWKFELPNHGKPFLTRKLSDDSYVDKDANPVVLEGLKWYQVVISTDQTAWSFYVNGTLAVTWPLDNVATPIAADPDVNLVIGSFLPNDMEWDKAGWWTSFHGIMDDLRIYNKALTTAEVTALYAMESVD
jgi:hypothetical protein